MIVKHFAKLALFFSFSFIGILLVSSLISLFEEWVKQAVLFPPGERLPLNILTFLSNSVSAAFFSSILLSLSYASRRHLAYPVVFVILLTFSLIFSSAVYVGLDRFARLGDFSVKQPANPAQLTHPGFIYNPGSRDTRFVFLLDPLKPGSPRVVASEDLYYQRHGASLDPSPLPFAKEKSVIFGSIARDFLQSSLYFQSLFRAGSGAFWVYIGSLAIFLLSLGCMVNISYWHLANLFFATLVFRGALALETFLNQADINGLLRSFAGNAIPGPLINPLIYGILSALILLYAGLVYLARGRIANA